ncbi:MAG: class I SAM-dependent methyltransferase [Candidatus Hodarchaeales archaeon]|jgi:ubiquinone/menaquinone biosynthesis C-methylase UbiE
MKIEAVQKRYDWYSRFYDKFEAPMEQMAFKPLRKKVIGSLYGQILEVGVGSGKNLPYYRSSARVIGIDISPQMLKKVREKNSTFHGESLELKRMNAEQLMLKDATFDIVVCTFVLCSVPNPIQAIQEMFRVLKPNGRLILLEHVLSEMPLLAFLQKVFNPFTRGIFGYNIDRDTVKNIKRVKGVIVNDQNLTKTDILKFIVCRKK